MKFIRLYLRYVKVLMKQKWKYLFAWIFAIVLLSLNNLSVFLIGTLVDQVTVNHDRLPYLVLWIGVVLALPIIFEPITFHLKTRAFSRAVNDITSQIYNNALDLDYNFHVNKQTGKLISIIINSPDVISMFLWQFEWFVIENFAALLIPIVLMAFISPEVSLALVVIMIVLSPAIIWSLKVNVKRRVVLKDADYDRNTAIVDGISNFETVRSFGTEIRETTLLREKLAECERAMNRYQDTFRLLDLVSRAFGLVLFAVGAVITTYLFHQGNLTLGSVVVIITYLIQMIGRFMNTIFSFRDVVKNLPVVEDFYELLDAKHDISEVENPHYLNNPEGKVEFKAVSFGYNESTPILSSLDLEIEPSQNIALVGPSGGGKSTITRLLMRYYDVVKGEILIDGVNVKNLAIDNLRQLIGVVPQEPILFNRSILYNVGYAIEGIDDDSPQFKDRVIDACKKAHVHDFIESLPNGYNTFVGERGVKLSGGQKQRLAIARVLIKDPKIIIFDEATSMLDSESERAIQLAFKELSKEKTTIVIAHRLSTIIHCDNIFVIDKGEVVENGKHSELIENKGIYANLWEIQSGGFVAESR